MRGDAWWATAAAARDHIAALGRHREVPAGQRGQGRPRHLVQCAGRDDHHRAGGQVERAEQQRVELVGRPGGASASAPAARSPRRMARRRRREEHEVVGGGRRPDGADLVQPARRRPSPRRRAARRRSGPARRGRCRRGGGAARGTTRGGSRSRRVAGPQRLRPHGTLVARTGRAATAAVRRSGRRRAPLTAAGTAENPRALARWRSAHRSTSRPRRVASGQVHAELGQLAGEAGAGGAHLDGAGRDVAEALQLGDALAQHPPGPGRVALGHAGAGARHPVVGPVGGGAPGADGLGLAAARRGPGAGRPAPSPAGPPTPAGRGPRPASRCGASSPAIRPHRSSSRAGARPASVVDSELGLEADVEREAGPLRPLRGPQPTGGGGGVALGLGGVTGGEAGPGQQQAGLVEVGHVVRRPQAVDGRLRLGRGRRR